MNNKEKMKIKKLKIDVKGMAEHGEILPEDLTTILKNGRCVSWFCRYWVQSLFNDIIPNPDTNSKNSNSTVLVDGKTLSCRIATLTKNGINLLPSSDKGVKRNGDEVNALAGVEKAVALVVVCDVTEIPLLTFYRIESGGAIWDKLFSHGNTTLKQFRNLTS